jgi:hypothetical protein
LGACASFPPAASARIAGSDPISGDANTNAVDVDAGRRMGDIVGDIVLAHCRP